MLVTGFVWQITPRSAVGKNRADYHAATELLWATFATQTSTVPARYSVMLAGKHCQITLLPTSGRNATGPTES